MSRVGARSIAPIVLLPALGLAALLLGTLLPADPLQASGWASILVSAYAVLLAVWFVLVCMALGRFLLNHWVHGGVSQLEHACLAAGLGMGTVSYSLLALGLLKILTPQSILMMLMVLWAIGFREGCALAEEAIDFLSRLSSTWLHLSRMQKWVLAAAALLGLLTILRALEPPWGYDALMYHLEGPRQFLAQRAIYPSHLNWRMDFPFTVELLYSVGVGLGSDSFANLIHVSFFGLVACATYAVARRLGDGRTATVALVFLLGMPLLGIWAVHANVDLGWMAFETLSVMCVFIWYRNGSARWLVLAGSLMGFALGTKYLAATGVGTTAVLVLLNPRGGTARSKLRSLGVVALATALVASPWYLKNWVWFGDPLFPYFGGGSKLDPFRMRMLSGFSAAFGAVHTPLDFVLLPFLMFLRPLSFTMDYPELPPTLALPGLSLLVFLAYPLLTRLRPVSNLYLGALVRLLTWATLLVTLPALRYLVPVFPLASVVAGHTLVQLGEAKSPARIFYPAGLTAASGFLGLAVIAQVLVILRLGSFAVVVGRESRDQFMRRVIPTYAAMRYAETQMRAGTRLLTTGDGRAYYFGNTSMHTDDQFLWVKLLLSSRDPSDFETRMRQLGATDLLISQQDMDFFIVHPPTPEITAAIRFLTKEVLPLCGIPVFVDRQAEIYEIHCPSNHSGTPASSAEALGKPWARNRNGHSATGAMGTWPVPSNAHDPQRSRTPMTSTHARF